MNSTFRFEIHVVANEEQQRQTVAAIAADSSPLTVDVGVASDLEELERALFAMFQVPIPARSIDAVISLAPDIDLWMPDAASWVVLVNGFDRCPPEVARTAADIWPPILDRWRSMAEKSFVAVLIASNSRPLVLDALRAENVRLKEFGELPDTVAYVAPVPIFVDGVRDEAASVGATSG
jgi:hypothetical protein